MHLSLFAPLWAFAHLIHTLDSLRMPLASVQLSVLFAALLYLIVPRLRWFVLMCVLQIVSLVFELPEVANHWLFAGFVNGVVACGFLAHLGKSAVGEPRLRLEEGFSALVPVIRILVICLYVFSLFHKLNSDFFDPSVSCILFFYELAQDAQFFLPLPELGSNGKSAVMHAVFAMEIALPLLLFWKRSWFAGLSLLLVFHLLTSGMMRDFPMIMIAASSVFVPVQVLGDISKKWEQVFRLRLLIPILAILTTLLSFLVFFGPRQVANPLFAIQIRLWTLVILILFFFFVNFVLQKKLWRFHEEHPLRTRSLLLIFPLLYFLNASSPYLGLKTTTSLSMFSNLRTEGGVSNHFLIPDLSWQPFTYQLDIVEIVKADDPQLQELYMEQGWVMTWHMLQRHIRTLAERGRRDIVLTYKRNGEVYETENAELEPEFIRGESLLSQKLLYFHPVEKVGSPVRCIW